MKLLRSEICAIIISALFLALCLGFVLGQKKTEPGFIVTESSFDTSSEVQSSENVRPSPVTREDYVININTATPEELELLDGIGPVIAERIVSYREAEGGFKKIEDITKVQGIGAAVFENIREHIRVE